MAADDRRSGAPEEQRHVQPLSDPALFRRPESFVPRYVWSMILSPPPSVPGRKSTLWTPAGLRPRARMRRR